MKRLTAMPIAVVTAALALLGATLIPASAQALGQYTSKSEGIDISYPSCRLNQKIDLTKYSFVVAGVSGGSVYTDNKCAALEASYSANSSLYVNTGLYTGGTNYQLALSSQVATCKGEPTCGAYTYGYRAGQHAYEYAVSQKLGTTATTWWLDVEETNTWDPNHSWNVQSIQGEYDALAAEAAPGSTIGIYAVPSQWNKIVGADWPSTGHAYPVWAANGFRTADAANISQYCTDPTYSVTGGLIYMVQYVDNYGTKTSLDHDYVC